jgi:hypothetical protein
MTPAQRIVIQLGDEVGVPPLTQAQIDRLMDILREEFRQAEERGRQAGLVEAAGLIRADQQRLIDAVLMLPEGSEARARAAARVETAFQLEGKIEACAAGEKTADA